MNNQDNMTRAQFIAQYQGVWAPSDWLWLGMDFGYNGCEYRFQTDSMDAPQNPLLPDGREARYFMYRKTASGKPGSAYELLGAFATTADVVANCAIEGRTFGQILDSGSVELLGQD